jgi:hypothetical protein
MRPCRKARRQQPTTNVQIQRSSKVTNTDQTENPTHTAPKPAETWVYEVLQPDQVSTAKFRLGRRKLNRGTVLILWALRLYVILMVLLIGVQVWNALHPGA